MKTATSWQARGALGLSIVLLCMAEAAGGIGTSRDGLEEPTRTSGASRSRSPSTQMAKPRAHSTSRGTSGRSERRHVTTIGSPT